MPIDLVLVTLDTVRADHLGAYGAADVLTPNLDALAREGVRFAEVWAPAPLTLPSHSTILSGLLPPNHGVRLNGGGAFPEQATTLATNLQAHGYRTGAFVGAFVLERRFGLARGFDHYDDELDPGARANAGLEAERSAREVVDRAIAWLDAVDRSPYFMWVHLYDAHAPYEPPEPYRTRFSDRLYDGEIASADAEVGRLFRAIANRGTASRTVVAVAGDHGEALGEHGELTHGLLLYEASLRVPLLLRFPGRLAAGTVVATPTTLADVAPTLAGLIGHPFPKALKLDGRDLSSDLLAGNEPPSVDMYAESRYAATFGWAPLAALRRGSFKYVAAPQPELFDLSADPSEARNLLLERPSLADQYVGALATLATGTAAASPIRLDDEARARLESLGYLTGGATGRRADAPDPKLMVGLFRDFEKAHWALEAGRLAEARQTLERLAREDPRNPVFTGQLAEVSRRNGDSGRAVELYRRALELNPDDREARYNLALTLQEAGRHSEAMVALRTAIALDPGRPEAHNALGLALVAAGEPEAALTEFSRAAELDPRDARTQNNRANVLREIGRTDEAEAAYRNAVKLDPDYADPLNGLGAIAIARGQPDMAVDLFDQALELAPQQFETWLNRGIALELAGRRGEAIAAYREFLGRTRGSGQLQEQRRVAVALLARLEATEGARSNRKEGGKGGTERRAGHGS